IHIPVSCIEKPILPAEDLELIHGAVSSIPSSIHPEVLVPEFLIADLVDQAQGSARFHSAPSSVRYGYNDGLAVVMRGVILQDVPSQEIVRVETISLPRQQKDFGSPNLFTGMEGEMGPFHACFRDDRRVRRGSDGDGPFSGPTY